LLLARNFSIEALNAFGGTALGAALWASVNAPRPDHVRIIEALIDAGAHVDERWFTGRRPEIEAALRRSRSDAPVSEAREQVIALRRRGDLARGAKNYDEAIRVYEEAASLCRDLGDSLLLAHTLRHIGDIQHEAGRPKLAETMYAEALEIYRRERPSTLDLANAIRPYAVLKEEIGATAEAERMWEEAHDLYAKANVPPGAAESAVRLARLMHARGDREHGDQWMRVAKAIAAASGDREMQQRLGL
jgi:tetratricopeptide (TPR) repeat protein